MTTVTRPTRAVPQSAPRSKQAHADAALALGKKFPRMGFHYSAADASSMPKDAGQIIEVLLKFGNGARDRAGRLGLDGGWSHNEPSLSPAQTLEALKTIEQRSGKKISTLLADAAKKPGVTPGAKEVLGSLSTLLRGGLEKQPGFASAAKLYATKLPAPGGPSLREQQEALAKAEAREAAERAQRAWNSPGVDWNWARGNRPSQAPEPLFVRK